MFELDAFVESCRTALQEVDARRSVREVLLRSLERPSAVADVLGKDRAGIEILYNAEDLTVLNVIWAPGMQLLPHDHRMWAAIGIYGGTEDNTMYKRTPDTLLLGPDAIHSVANPERRFTGAIHVYGGDFVNAPRSQWDPDTLMEQPYDLAYIRSLFEQANAEWAAQVDHDLDEEAIS